MSMLLSLNECLDSRGLHEPDFSGPGQDRPRIKDFEKSKFRPELDPNNFFSDFGPDHLGLSDFKTD